MALVEERGGEYHADIITNGYLLTQEVVDLLDRCKVTSAQITIDGMGATHDATRRLAGGGPTFERITTNLRDAKIPFKVNIRHNVHEGNKHEIETLVTSCPICLKVFKEEYNLEGVEILHHSEYIDRLIASGAITVKSDAAKYTYHDPCELGRGSGIYDAPRRVIGAVGALIEPAHNRSNALCCGASLANTVIDDSQQVRIAERMTSELEATECETIVTACPLCNKAIARTAHRPTRDLAEIVAQNIS
jgi:Fe-S oxidoreductase